MLQPELERVEGAKQQRAEQRLAGAPGGEHRQRDADPAAPIGHLEEEGVEGRHGQERAAKRHQGRAGDDRADADRDDVQALRLDGRRVLADRPHREAERRAVEHEAREPRTAPSARNVSGVCWNRAGPRNGRSDRPGICDGLERRDPRRRRDVRQRDAVDEVGQRLSPTA